MSMAARRYRAFISYSHSDARVAAWLHRSLETYRVPKLLRGTEGEFGLVPERVSPIFRDREELASSGHLGARVQGALADSDALIVICSPVAAASRWVNEEILSFKRLSGSARIYCLIVDGEPHAGGARECFPPALLFELEADGQLGQHPAEPIAADLRAGKDGKTLARLKLIAGLLGVGLDTLRKREAQRRTRRLLAISVGSVAGMALASVLAVTALIERNHARREQLRAEVASYDAERRQLQAEDMLGFMLGDLRTKLEKVGRLDLLDSVDDKATSYFANLDPRDLTDTTLARQAQTLTDIGQVRLNQARYPEALASFQSAEARSRALASRHPQSGDFLFDRGQAEFWVGYVYWQNREMDNAQSWLTRYRDTCRAVYAIDPAKAAWQHELAYGDHGLAVVDLERGQFDSAAEGFRRSRATRVSMLEKTPADTQLQFEVADEDSWLGNVEEQRGHLAAAESLLASKVDVLRRIAATDTSDPKWKMELSTSELMHSELLRVQGKPAQAETLADAAVERLKTLVAHDPANKGWSHDYVHALIQRAAARIGAGKTAGARSDLALAQPLIDMSSAAQAQDRYVRRDALDALILRMHLALQSGERSAARVLAASLKALQTNNANAGKPQPADEIGRYAMSLVQLGMSARLANEPGEADSQFSAARALLAPVANGTLYWRVLDPWVRIVSLGGDQVEALRLKRRLADTGYAPLFPWPASVEAKVARDSSVSNQRQAPAAVPVHGTDHPG